MYTFLGLIVLSALVYSGATNGIAGVVQIADKDVVPGLICLGGTTLCIIGFIATVIIMVK